MHFQKYVVLLIVSGGANHFLNKYWSVFYGYACFRCIDISKCLIYSDGHRFWVWYMRPVKTFNFKTSFCPNATYFHQTSARFSFWTINYYLEEVTVMVNFSLSFKMYTKCLTDIYRKQVLLELLASESEHVLLQEIKVTLLGYCQVKVIFRLS